MAQPISIPFVGGAYAGRSSNLNAQVCQNLYIELDKTSDKPRALVGTSGLLEYIDPSLSTSPVRGMIVIQNIIFVVIGSGLYAIYSDGTISASLGTLETSIGKVYLEFNGSHLMIVDCFKGYVYTWAADPSVFAKITDTNFPDPSTLTFQDGYFIISSPAADESKTIATGETETINAGETDYYFAYVEINGTGTLAIDSSGAVFIIDNAAQGRFYISDLNDPTSWDAAMYANAEGSPDKIVRVISVHRDLWLLGGDTAEVWQHTGATFPFSRIPGAFLEVGSGAAASAVKADNSLYWLSNKRQFVRAEGYRPIPVSTPQIDYQIAQYSTVEDCDGFSFIEEGHEFIQWTFPTEGKTWLYDCSTKEWATRSSYIGGSYTARHRAACCCDRDGINYVGDYTNGKIYKMLSTVYTDDTARIQRIRAAPAINKNRLAIFHHELEIEFEAGVGLSSGDAADTAPQASLDWSDDGGHTWKTAVDAPIGATAAYTQRTRWRRLGRSEVERIYRLTITAKVKIIIAGAYLRATPGLS